MKASTPPADPGPDPMELITLTPPTRVPPVPASTPPPWLRPIWLALIIFGATLVAFLSVIVLRFLGADTVTAISAGGAAWLGTAGLGLAFRTFLGS